MPFAFATPVTQTIQKKTNGESAPAERTGKMKEREEELLAEIAGHQKYLEAINTSPTVRVGKAVTWPARKLRGKLSSVSPASTCLTQHP